MHLVKFLLKSNQDEDEGLEIDRIDIFDIERQFGLVLKGIALLMLPLPIIFAWLVLGLKSIPIWPTSFRIGKSEQATEGN